MKKKLVVSSILVGFMILLAACGNKEAAKTTDSSSATQEPKVIKVASHLPPMTDIVKLAGEVLEKDNYKLELVQVSDNIQYNEVLKNKEVDANFAQHQPFMEKFNAEKNANLVAVQKIYNAKVGFYSKDVKDLKDLPKGGKVALPSDVSNQGRALAILAGEGLITLKDGVGFNGTIKDVTENPHDFQWLEIDLLNLADAYNEKDMVLVYNYPTYIAKIGLKPADALILEKNIDERFAISLVAREDNVDSPEIQALKKAMTSPEVKEFLEKEHSDTLVPAF